MFLIEDFEPENRFVVSASVGETSSNSPVHVLSEDPTLENMS
jgi:hypothetical protein